MNRQSLQWSTFLCPLLTLAFHCNCAPHLTGCSLSQCTSSFLQAGCPTHLLIKSGCSAQPSMRVGESDKLLLELPEHCKAYHPFLLHLPWGSSPQKCTLQSISPVLAHLLHLLEGSFCETKPRTICAVAALVVAREKCLLLLRRELLCKTDLPNV